jgi:hypothetical protein
MVAESALAVRRDVRMEPRNAILGVVADDLAAMLRASLILRDAEALREVSFDQVAGHGQFPLLAEKSWLREASYLAGCKAEWAELPNFRRRAYPDLSLFHYVPRNTPR